MKTFLVVVLTIIFLSPLAQAQSLDEIIKKNLEAKGGVEKIRALETYKMIGKRIINTSEMPYTLWFKKPNQFKIELVIKGTKMTFTYDGKVAWQIRPSNGSSSPQEMTGDQAEQFKDTGEMMDEPFIDYQKKGHKIVLIGKEDMDGKIAYKVKLTRRNGQEIYFFIDSKTFLELKTSVTMKMQDGQEVTTETVLGDYKPVAGVMIPHSMNTIANQQKMSVTIEAVEPNVELAEDFFKMPEKKNDSSSQDEKK